MDLISNVMLFLDWKLLLSVSEKKGGFLATLCRKRWTGSIRVKLKTSLLKAGSGHILLPSKSVHLVFMTGHLCPEGGLQHSSPLSPVTRRCLMENVTPDHSRDVNTIIVCSRSCLSKETRPPWNAFWKKVHYDFAVCFPLWLKLGGIPEKLSGASDAHLRRGFSNGLFVPNHLVLLEAIVRLFSACSRSSQSAGQAKMGSSYIQEARFWLNSRKTFLTVRATTAEPFTLTAVECSNARVTKRNVDHPLSDLLWTGFLHWAGGWTQ